MRRVIHVCDVPGCEEERHGVIRLTVTPANGKAVEGGEKFTRKIAVCITHEESVKQTFTALLVPPQ